MSTLAESASRLSDLLADATLVTWTVSLVAFAADAAFARPSVPRVDSPRRSATLVGPGAATAARAEQRDLEHEDVGRTGGAEPPPSDPAPQGRALGIGWATFVLGTLLLAGSVVARGVAADRAPWGNMYEFALTGCLVVAVSVLALRRRFDLSVLAVWITAVLLLTLALGTTVLYVPAAPLVPALQSPWLVIHVAAAIVSAAAFTIAMVASALYLVRGRAERLGRTDGRYVSRLPSADSLDRTAYRVVAFAFPIWTFAVVAGAIWAEYAWGRYWGWDPKEVWALVTWIVYAAYLHARTTAGWQGRRAAVVALVGYTTLLFNFFGVNIFFVGLHSYGGL